MSSDLEQVLAGTGLCGQCAHVLVRPTRRGTTYLRCGLAADNPAYPKYPRLPVLSCPGFRAESGRGV